MGPLDVEALKELLQDRRVLIGVGLAVLALVAVVYYFFAAPATKTYTVQLLANGKPLANVDVVVEFPDGSIQTYTTNDQGFVTFEGPPGARIIKVSGGYTLPGPVDADVGTVELEAPKRKVVVEVVDEEGNPLEASVTIKVDGETVKTETGSTVEAVFEAPDSAKVVIEAEAGGYKTARLVRKVSDISNPVRIKLRKAEGEEKRYGTIVLLVRDEGGAGVDGEAHIYVLGTDVPVQTVPVEKGFASAEGLQFGTYTVKIFVNGALAATKVVTLNRESVEEEITIKRVQTESGTLVVKDKSTGAPIAGATVEVDVGEKYTLETNADGAVEINMEAGACANVYVSAEGYKPGSTTVCGGETKEISLEKLPSSGKIVVTVLSILGQPVPNAQVYALSDGHVVGSAVTTDDRGRAILEALAPGTYTIKATYGSYSGESEPVEVRAGRTTDVEVTLFAGEANVHICATFDGAPASASVDVYVRGQKVKEAETGIDGCADLTVPADVPVRFYVFGPVTFVSQEYRFVPNETREINVDVPTDFSGVKILGVYSEGMEVEGISPGSTYEVRFLYRAEEGKVVVAVTQGYWGVSLIGSGWEFHGWSSPPSGDPIRAALQSDAEGKSIAVRDAIRNAVVEERIGLSASATLTGDVVTVFVGAGGAEDSVSLPVGDSMTCTDYMCYSVKVLQDGRATDTLKAEYPADVHVAILPRADNLRVDVVYVDPDGKADSLCSLSQSSLMEKDCPVVPKEGALEIRLRAYDCSGACDLVDEVSAFVGQAVAEHREMGLIVAPLTLVARRVSQTVDVQTYDAEKMEEEGLVPVDARIYVYAYVSTSYQTYKLLVTTASADNGRARIRITPAENWDHVEIVARARDYDDARVSLSLAEHAVTVDPETVDIDLTQSNTAEITLTNNLDVPVDVSIVGDSTECVSVDAEPDTLEIDSGASETVTLQARGGERCAEDQTLRIFIRARRNAQDVDRIDIDVIVHPKGDCLRITVPSSVSLGPGDESFSVDVENICDTDVNVSVSAQTESGDVEIYPEELEIPPGMTETIILTYSPASAYERGVVTLTLNYTAGEIVGTKQAKIGYTYSDAASCLVVKDAYASSTSEGIEIYVGYFADPSCGELKTMGVQDADRCSVQGYDETHAEILCTLDYSMYKDDWKISLDLRSSFESGDDWDTVEVQLPNASGEPFTLDATPPTDQDPWGRFTLTNKTPYRITLTLKWDPTDAYVSEDGGATIVNPPREESVALRAFETKEFLVAHREAGTRIVLTASIDGYTVKKSIDIPTGTLAFTEPPILNYETEVVGVTVSDLVGMCKTAWCSADAFGKIKESIESVAYLDPLEEVLAKTFYVVVGEGETLRLDSKSLGPGYYKISYNGEKSWSYINLCERGDVDKAACTNLAERYETLLPLKDVLQETPEICSVGAALENTSLAKSTTPLRLVVTEDGAYPCTKVYSIQVTENTMVLATEYFGDIDSCIYLPEGDTGGCWITDMGKYSIWVPYVPEQESEVVYCPGQDSEIRTEPVTTTLANIHLRDLKYDEEESIVYVEWPKDTPKDVVYCTCRNTANAYGGAPIYNDDGTLVGYKFVCKNGSWIPCQTTYSTEGDGKFLCIEEGGTHVWVECADSTLDRRFSKGDNLWACTREGWKLFNRVDLTATNYLLKTDSGTVLRIASITLYCTDDYCTSTTPPVLRRVGENQEGCILIDLKENKLTFYTPGDTFENYECTQSGGNYSWRTLSEEQETVTTEGPSSTPPTSSGWGVVCGGRGCSIVQSGGACINEVVVYNGYKFPVVCRDGILKVEVLAKDGPHLVPVGDVANKIGSHSGYPLPVCLVEKPDGSVDTANVDEYWVVKDFEAFKCTRNRWEPASGTAVLSNVLVVDVDATTKNNEIIRVEIQEDSQSAVRLDVPMPAQCIEVRAECGRGGCSYNLYLHSAGELVDLGAYGQYGCDNQANWHKLDRSALFELSLEKHGRPGAAVFIPFDASDDPTRSEDFVDAVREALKESLQGSVSDPDALDFLVDALAKHYVPATHSVPTTWWDLPEVLGYRILDDTINPQQVIVDDKATGTISQTYCIQTGDPCPVSNESCNGEDCFCYTPNHGWYNSIGVIPIGDEMGNGADGRGNVWLYQCVCDDEGCYWKYYGTVRKAPITRENYFDEIERTVKFEDVSVWPWKIKTNVPHSDAEIDGKCLIKTDDGWKLADKGETEEISDQKNDGDYMLRATCKDGVWVVERKVPRERVLECGRDGCKILQTPSWITIKKEVDLTEKCITRTRTLGGTEIDIKNVGERVGDYLCEWGFQSNEEWTEEEQGYVPTTNYALWVQVGGS